MEHLRWSSDAERARPKTPYLCAGFEQHICTDPRLFWEWQYPYERPRTESAHEICKHLQGHLFFGLVSALCAAAGYTFRVDDFIDPLDRFYINSSKVAPILQRLSLLELNFKTGQVLYPLLGRQSTRARSDVRDFAVQAFFHSKFLIKTGLETLESQFAAEATISNDPWNNELFNVLWSIIMLLEILIEPFADVSDCLETTACAEPWWRWVPWQRKISEDARSQLHEDLVPSRYNFPTTGLEDGTFRADKRTFHYSCDLLPLANGLSLANRCPSLLRKSNISPLDIYMLISMPNDRHFNHDSCSLVGCKAYNINKLEYEKRHAADCHDHANCASRLLGIHRALLEDLIASDKIPLVRSTKKTNRSGVCVEIVDGTEIEDFVAISHVWAGGLGNFEDNSHFPCRLEELHSALKAEKPSTRGPSVVHYWLDTLCIPATKTVITTATGELIDLKMKAIGQMAHIYAKSQAVFVVDPDLQKLRAKKSTRQQIKLALMSSSWMARSWTLQEAALAVELKFSFYDSITHLETIDPKASLTDTAMLQSLWKNDVFPWNAGLYATDTTAQGESAWIRNLQSETRFRLAWNELRGRSSTEVEDLPAIFAVLLGLSAEEVLKHGVTQSRQKAVQKQPGPRRPVGEKSAARMEAILKSQLELPVALLFAPIHPDSDTWCPLFPTSAGPPELLVDHMGKLNVTSEGHFDITDLKKVRLLQCAQALPAGRTVHISETRGYLTWQLYFPDTFKRAETEPLLLIAPEYKCGLCFTVTQQDDSGISARFAAHFSCYPAPINPIETTPKALEAMTVSGLHKNISTDYPLRLDMGMSTPRLEWSRSQSYPFLATTHRITRFMKVLDAVYQIFLMGFVAFPAIFFTGLWVLARLSNVSTSTSTLIATLLARFALIAVAIFIRVRIAKWERRFVYKSMQATIQPIWAASFRAETTMVTPATVLEKVRNKAVKKWILPQLILLLSSTIWYILIIKIEISHCDDDVVGGNVSSTMACASLFPLIVLGLQISPAVPVWVVIAQPAIFWISFETCWRVLVLVCARSWRTDALLRNFDRQQGTLGGSRAYRSTNRPAWYAALLIGSFLIWNVLATATMAMLVSTSSRAPEVIIIVVLLVSFFALAAVELLAYQIHLLRHGPEGLGTRERWAVSEGYSALAGALHRLASLCVRRSRNRYQPLRAGSLELESDAASENEQV